MVHCQELELFIPYDSPKNGQMDIAQRIVEAFSHNASTVIEAPNGFGKTTAALSASFHIASELDGGVVYGVRTKRQAERVLREAILFRPKFNVKVSALLSMSDGCILKDGEQVKIQEELLPNYCMTKVTQSRCIYFSNLASPSAIEPRNFDSLSQMIHYSKENSFCPYMYSRRQSYGSQILVVTYSHILNRDRMNSLAQNREGWRNWLLICDEAHNLPELAYETNSRLIHTDDLETVYRLAVEMNDLSTAELASSLIKGAMEVEDEEITTLREMIPLNQMTFSDAILYLSIPRPRDPYGMYSNKQEIALMRFTDFAKYLSQVYNDEDVRFLIRRAGEGRSLKVIKLEPDLEHLKKVFSSVVYLSATASSLPSSYPRFRVGFEERYLRELCLTVVDTSVSTEYKKRTEQMYNLIGQRIAEVRESVEGPIAVFFPSYPVLEAVRERLHVDADFLLERQKMSVTEQEAIITSLTGSSKGTMLAVSGGKFAEGEDYSSGALRCVVVVGLPLPPPTLELKERMKFLAKKYSRAEAYLRLMLLPAVNRVVQAAGRAVRGRERKSVVVLMDSRFGKKHILDLLPSWLNANLAIIENDKIGDLIFSRLNGMNTN